MIGNRIERYTYPSFVGAILLAIVLLVTGAPGPLIAVAFGLAGLIALLHARVGQRDRGNALAAALMAGVTAAFVAVADLIDYL